MMCVRISTFSKSSFLRISFYVSYTICIQLYWGYAISSLSAIAMISGIEPLLKLKASLIPQILIILTLLFHPAAQMLIGGATVTPERSYAMHLGHLANYIAWQSNIFIWNIIGPDKHWISQYGGGSKSVKAA